MKMKIIGMIGGMSWESSAEYYRIINETVKAKLGGLHSARCILYSVDFEEIETFQHTGNWKEATKCMVDAARSCEKAGADFVIICTNTMHRMADDVQAHIKIPLLHIADATAEKIRTQGLKTVGLLGTKYTMKEDFLKGRLIDKFSLDVLVPTEDEQEIIHTIIYEELCLGEIKEQSRKKYRKIIETLTSRGAEGIILGCTEIPLLVQQQDSRVPLFDTTRIHAEAAVELALSG